jgi:hypothetical protein
MKKVIVFAVCVPFLLGGLFCLHLAAQPGIVTSKVKNVSLLDPKIGEWSERELLEMKVDRYRQIAEHVKQMCEVGLPAGTASALAEAYAHLANAEVELYRHTGEQKKLLAALDAKVDALTDKVRAVTATLEMAVAHPMTLSQAEIQLLDALLERKRGQIAGGSKEPATTSPIAGVPLAF